VSSVGLPRTRIRDTARTRVIFLPRQLARCAEYVPSPENPTLDRGERLVQYCCTAEAVSQHLLTGSPLITRLNLATVRSALLRGTSVLGIVLLSVVTTLLVQRMVAPPRAAAQAGQLQEARASKFTLVGSDGTILATLQASTVDGNGQLNVFDAKGNKRARVQGAGLFVSYDVDGVTPRFVAGYQYPQVPGPTGNPPVNGIQLDPQGAITVLPPPSSP
jgi:hypothetical protein